MIVRLLLAIGAVASLSAAAAAQPAGADALTLWSGPGERLPPFTMATPATLVPAYKAAVAEYQAELDAIARNPEPPTFSNSVEALDRAGRRYRRAKALLDVHIVTASTPEWTAAAGELKGLAEKVISRASTDPAIFTRVQRVNAALPQSAPGPEAARLTELTFQAMRQAGAGLPQAKRDELASIEARIADRLEAFGQNLAHDEQQLLFVTDERRLAGLPDTAKAAAAAAAAASGHPGEWGIAANRSAVWAVQTNVADRSLREDVWRLWTGRGAHDGQFDNRGVVNDVIELRGQKARLLGYPAFADMVLAQRMAGTSATALALLDPVWRTVLAAEVPRSAELAKLAAADGVTALRPWDRIYYLDKLTKSRFAIDGTEIAGYFELGRVRDAMFAAAHDVYGYDFVPLRDVQTVSPDIEVYRVERAGKAIGVTYLDLHPRPGKRYGSFSNEYRVAGDGMPGDLPVAALYSSPPPGLKNGPLLLPYDYANVLFHEFGHVLHMLSSQSQYRGTGSLAVPWDFVEVPSLLNERWLLTDRTLDRLSDYRTGKPMPADLRDRLRRSRDFARVFSVNPEYLASAIVDLRLHMAADGRKLDVGATENAILAQYGLPDSIDPEMRTPHAYHTFSPQYASNLYTYLWSDAAAADIAEVFLRAPDQFFDKTIGASYNSLILGRGHRVPIDQAYREFHGRSIDPSALMRRFGLAVE